MGQNLYLVWGERVGGLGGFGGLTFSAPPFENREGWGNRGYELTVEGWASPQSSCEHGASVKEKNDFYFLLRLTQEAKTD